MSSFLAFGQFTVTNTNDAGPGSFRQAVIDANTSGVASTITFNAGINPVLTSGPIAANVDVAISGDVAGNTIFGSSSNNRLLFLSGGTNSIANLTFQDFMHTATTENGGGIAVVNGIFTATNCTFTNNEANGAVGGGAVLVRNVSSTFTDCSFTNNRAVNTSTGSGGAILVDVGGMAMIVNCSFNDNTSVRAGGAIESNSPDLLTITNSTFDANFTGSAPGNGGALHITGPANSNITGGSFTNNTAAREGGGLWNGSGTMTVTDVMIDANDAQGAAGDEGGGGIFNNGGTLVVTGTTMITNNTASGASGSGGGIFNLTPGTLNIDGITISGNTANRAGGGIELNAMAGETYTFNDIVLDGNSIATPNPGNGGGLHITGAGDVVFNGGSVVNNSANEGGGLWNHNGNMTVNGTVLTGNSALGPNTGGGALFNLGGGTLAVDAATTLEGNIAMGATPGGRGGAIFNNTGGTLDLASGLTISGNYASRAGGAIEDASGTNLTLDGIILDGNSAGVDIGLGAMANPGNGGALHLSGTTNAMITNATVTNNLAASEGGGLWNNAGTMTVDATDVNNNTSSGNDADNGGGGIFNNGGTLSIVNGTFVNNNLATGTSGSGGGVFSTAGDVSISDVQIFLNSANRAGGGIEIIDGTLTITNTTNAFNDVNGTAGSPNPGNGGALHVSGVATITITGGTVGANLAASEGGGVWNQVGSTMTLDGVSISSNIAYGNAADNGGAGVFNNGGDMNILNATIEGNMAVGTSGSGGGILSTAGTITVNTSDILSNAANRAGGGIEIIDGTLNVLTSNLNINNVNGFAGTPNPGNGGGLHVSGTAAIVFTDSFVNDNAAATEGGGLWNQVGSTMEINNTTLDGNFATGDAADNGGGGIFNNGGMLVVQNTSIISNNTASGLAGSGGGIQNVDGGTVEVYNSTITNNQANRAGGGIEDNSSVTPGTLTLMDVTLTNNTTGSAPGNGGGLHITGPGTAMITNGTASGNVAASEGGGLWNGSGTMTVDGTVIDGNTASGAGADNGGGGIFNAGGTLNVLNATITNNIADGASGSGGGILNDMGSLSVSDSELSGNTSMRAGGGIEVNSGGGTLDLTNVDLLNNSTAAAPGNGGGLHITGSDDSTITGGTASGNVAASEGGGLWNGSGIMTIDGMLIDSNEAQGPDADNGGGGVFNNGGTLNIINGTVVSNNLATGTSGSGGGLLSTDGDVTITDTSFDANAANRAGGAIEIIDGNLLFDLSEMINNDVNGTAGTPAPGNGGGLHLTGNASLIEITNSMILNNAAAREGGGLWNQSGSLMTVETTTIDGNISLGTAADDGGAGIFNNGGMLEVMASTLSNNDAQAGGNGGGIHNTTSGEVTVMVSTISNNMASSGNGGGIFNNGASFDINAATIAQNDASGTGGGIEATTSVSLINTIVALNTASSGTDVSGTFASNDYNLVGTDDLNVFPEQANDLEEADPVVGPLQDNGGATFTHELLLGSPAYNAGNPADVFVDQRGESVFDGIRDIGAFEAQDILLSIDGVAEVGSDIVVYPNPTQGQSIVRIPNTFGENITITIVELSSGKIVQQLDAYNGTYPIDLFGLANGVYILNIVSDENVASRKLIMAR